MTTYRIRRYQIVQDPMTSEWFYTGVIVEDDITPVAGDPVYTSAPPPRSQRGYAVPVGVLLPAPTPPE